MKSRRSVRFFVALAAGLVLAAWAFPAAAECGDGVCDITQEGCYSCPGDCGSCPGSPGGSCAGKCGYNTESCWCDELCHPYADCCADVCLQCPMLPGCSTSKCGNKTCDEGESCYSCPGDCGDCNLCGDTHCGEQEDCQKCPADCGKCESCGDGQCVAPEDCFSCPPDCGFCEGCGDGLCAAGENCFSCPLDCGECINCGDGKCVVGENCNNCAQDCGTCCGDKTCDKNAGEDCTTCPEDCGECADCGDGKCGEGETCSNCAKDCGDCCGNGVCEVELGETCELCPKDCKDCCGDGVCGSGEDCESCDEDCGECCGDGNCNAKHQEDCESCPEDCGKCECTVLPNTGNTWKFAFNFEEDLEAAGTGAALKIGLSAGVFKGANKDTKKCVEGLSGGGEVGACMKVVFNKLCVVWNLDIGGQCEQALVCEEPPQFVCDKSNSCCGGTIMGGATATRSWEPEKKFNIWKFEAKCGIVVSGSFGGSISGNAKWGPLCQCPDGAADITLRVKGGAAGGGSCGIKAFGKTYMGIGAEANACVNVGVQAGYGCGGLIGGPVGGASFKIFVSPFTLGWFTVSGLVKEWPVGSGCSGATDY